MSSRLGMLASIAIAFSACGGTYDARSNGASGPSAASAPVEHADATSCEAPPRVGSCMDADLSSCSEGLRPAVNAEASRAACPSPNVFSDQPCPRTSPRFAGCCLLRTPLADLNICYYGDAKTPREVCIDPSPAFQIPSLIAQRKQETHGWCAAGATTPELEAGREAVSTPVAASPAAEVAAAPPSTSPGNSVADRLRKLKEMFDEGLIDEATYDRKKKELVDAL